MDLSMEIAERCLEVVRSSVEAAAARERDEAAARLLSELELEDASKKVSCWGTRLLCHAIPSLAPQLLLSAVVHACVGGVHYQAAAHALQRILLAQAAEEKKGKAKKAKKKAAKAAKCETLSCLSVLY